MKHLKERNKQILEMFGKGSNYTEIAEYFGLTRQRVFAIVKAELRRTALSTVKTIDNNWSQVYTV